MEPSFDDLAAAYDLISPPDRRLKRDGPGLARWAAGAETLIDLACGTGAQAHFLATRYPELHIVACDLSPAMIAVADHHRPHPHIRYAVGDMRHPPEGSFDRLLIAGNSLPLLPDIAAVYQCIDGLAERCNQSGSVLLQWEPAAILAHNDRDSEFERADHRINKRWRADQGVSHMTVTVEGPRWRLRQDLSLLHLQPDDLKARCQEAGLTTVELWRDFDQRPWTPDHNGAVILVARR